MQIDVCGSHNVVAGRDLVQLVMHITDHLSPSERADRRLAPYRLTMLMAMIALICWGMFMVGVNYTCSVMHIHPWFGEGAIAAYGLVGFGWSMTAAAMRRWAEHQNTRAESL